MTGFCEMFDKDNTDNATILLDYLRNPGDDDNFCVVTIENTDFPDTELIINRRKNFEDKADYYERAYDDNLVLRSCDKIRISSVLFLDDLSNLGFYFR